MADRPPVPPEFEIKGGFQPARDAESLLSDESSSAALQAKSPEDATAPAAFSKISGDASISASNEKKGSSADARKTNGDHVESAVKMLEYVVKSEEDQKSIKPVFCMPYDRTNRKDWTESHYLQNKSMSKEQALSGSQKKEATRGANEKLNSKELYQKCKDLELKVTKKTRKSELLDILKRHETESMDHVDVGDKANLVALDLTNDFDEQQGRDKYGVILTSYDGLSYKYNDGHEVDTYVLSDPKPLLVFCRPTKPSVNEADPTLLRYLRHLLKNDHDRFSGCEDDLNSMIPHFTHEDVPAEGKSGAETCRNFIESALKYSTHSTKSSYEKLFNILSKGDCSDCELRLGFGHVRMLVPTTKNGEPHELRLVNGPLLEVPVEAQFKKESSDILIRTTRDAKIALNTEVIDAITSEGRSSAQCIDKLHKLAEETNVSSLKIDDSVRLRPFLDAASLLSCGGTVLSANNKTPSPCKKLVIADAWCLYSTERKTTPHSRDARSMIDYLKSGKREVTDPLRGLILGPEKYSEKHLKRNNPGSRMDERRLVYPLPASEDQKETGIRLLVNGEPVVNLFGPPGTGKTHSIVNIAGTALAEGKTVVVSSSNPRALTAFEAKLPPGLQNLVLNISNVEERGVGQLQMALESMIKSFSKSKQGDADIKRLEKQIEERKTRLQDIENIFEMSNEISSRLFDDDGLNKVLQIAGGLSGNAPWLVQAIILNEVKDISDSIEICRTRDWERVSFGKGDDFLDEELLQLIHKKAKDQNNGFSFVVSEKERQLESIKIEGKVPITSSDWELVMCTIKLRRNCIKPLLDCGCPKDATAGANFIAVLEEGRKLKAAIAALKEESKQALLGTFEAESTHIIQDQYRKLASDIEKLESKFVNAKVVVSLKKKLGEDALSTLKKLQQRLKRMGSSSLLPVNAKKERSSRQLDEFINLFKEAVKFMPFLVMTIEQVSIYLPPDHSCDIGIMDEASQSSCVAITFMARCKQMLVVGDDKQVSPSQCFLSEGRIRGLKRILPNIPTAEQLLPESSFFDLSMAAFPSSDVSLREHRRCDPQIIEISNTLFYAGELVPLRLTSKENCVHDVVVSGTRDKKKKTNVIEARKVADFVYDEIRNSSKDQSFRTIAVISLGGADQHKLIRKLVEEKTEHLIHEFGSDVVDRHNMLYGTSSDCQGEERDLVCLSAVHSAEGDRKLKEDQNWKAWNVALSRAKNRMVLFRSFGVKNLQPRDIRSRIFRFFMNATKPKIDCGNELMIPDGNPLVAQLENALVTSLEATGYKVCKMGGDIWSNALRVISGGNDASHSALVHIVNGGEDKEEWKTIFDQQLSLERAGRSCFLVDCPKLALSFDPSFNELLEFLNKTGLVKSGKRPASDASSNRAKKSRTHEGSTTTLDDSSSTEES